MNNYVPFLKLKVNEVGALSVLSDEIKSAIVPFFDLAKKDGMTEDEFQEATSKSAKSLARNLKGIKTFFIDNFDIDDSLVVNGKHNYNYVLEAFSSMLFIPVLGLDRAAGRNDLVFKAKANGIIKSNTIALRLLVDDFESFALVSHEIKQLMTRGTGLFSQWILILDNRVCLDILTINRAKILADFLNDSSKLMAFNAVIVTGSSFTSSIGDVIKVLTEREHARNELSIYRALNKQVQGFHLYLGDYTIVSPLYSDLNIPPEMMQNVMTPKVVYTHGDVHYIARGGAFRTNPRGYSQYNDIAEQLIKKSFYRGPKYSFGDQFLHDKANFIGKQVVPNSILKPTINTHITYMFKDFIL